MRRVRRRLSPRRTEGLTGVGFALGVVLIVVGAVFVWAVDVDVWLFSSSTTGILLMSVGAVVIIWNLVISVERSRTRRLQQGRYDTPPEH